MTTLTTIAAIQQALARSLTGDQQTLITAMLWATGFLCLLNIALAFFYRRKKIGEVISYYIACLFELTLFVLALLLQLHVTTVFFHLPPNLPVNQAEIGATLAIGIGLFPAAYWHRVNLSELPKRIAEDGQTLKNHEAGVHVRKNSTGEWMN